MSWDRPYYQKGCKPYLIYAVFNDCPGKIRIAESRHIVKEISETLEIRTLTKNQNAEYINSLYSDQLEDLLLEKGRSFYDKIVNSQECILLEGEIQKDEDLSYMRDTVGLIQSLLEQGAVGVFDMQALRWYSADEWEEYFFIEDKLEPMRHVSILCSQPEEGDLWIHTRGMRKFGRTDISILNVPERELEHAAETARRLTVQQALGVIIPPVFTMKVEGRRCEIKGSYVEAFENDDFGNAYYEFEWIRGVLRLIRGGRQ